MHGYSTLDAEKPRDPAKLVATSKQMAELLRSRNPNVVLHLMATWSRADQTYPATGAWAGQPIDAMARDVRAAYDKAAAGAPGVKSVIPVGEAWTRAIRTGVADPESIRRHRARQTQSVDLRPLPRQRLRLLPRGAGHLRQPHRTRSAFARRLRMFSLRTGLLAAAGKGAATGCLRPARKYGCRHTGTGGRDQAGWSGALRSGALRVSVLSIASRVASGFRVCA